MFKVNDVMTRTFHIKPPAGDGPFEFGYVVHACWAKPTNFPVTNPETDFPIVANCEDPFQITVEQLQPVNYGVTNQPLFKATVKHRKGEWPVGGKILTPTICWYPNYNQHENSITNDPWQPNMDVTRIDDETTEVILRISPIHMYFFGDALVPGYHLGIFQCLACGTSSWGEGYYSQLQEPIGVCPVMVYVDV